MITEAGGGGNAPMCPCLSPTSSHLCILRHPQPMDAVKEAKNGGEEQNRQKQRSKTQPSPAATGEDYQAATRQSGTLVVGWGCSKCSTTMWSHAASCSAHCLCCGSRWSSMRSGNSAQVPGIVQPPHQPLYTRPDPFEEQAQEASHTHTQCKEAKFASALAHFDCPAVLLVPEHGSGRTPPKLLHLGPCRFPHSLAQLRGRDQHPGELCCCHVVSNGVQVPGHTLLSEKVG
mmetsp:Transcript_10957/g.18999  ORF Transcript_10957/g.18999 Transcript_10957/m.18999 type:complete len:231 (+) Transcript_10957:269-961(+)